MAKRRQIFNISQLPDGVSGVDQFTELIDTPSSYTGQAGKSVRVNATETALEYYTPSEVGSTISFLDLVDTPSSYTGQAGRIVKVNAGGTALEFETSTYIASTRSINTNNGLTGGGDLSTDRTLGLTGQALALHNLATNGYIVRTGSGTVAARIFVAGTGISISNADGISGNTTITSTITQYTDSLARGAISLTTTGSSGAATYNSSTGVLNIPNYTLVGLGGFTNPMTTLGDIIYGFTSGAPTRLAGNTTTTKQYLSQTGTGSASAAPIWSTIAGSDVTGAALTSTNDTNVTLTLGGSASTSLLRAASLTLGWSGQLAVSRGGTGASTLTGVLVGNGTSAISTAVGTALQILRRNSGNTAYEFFTLNLESISNVIITTPSSGQVLSFDGTNWVNSTITGGGGGTVTSITAGTGLSASPSSPITTSGTLSVLYGTTAGTAAQGNDSRFHDAITIGTANGLSLSTQVLSLALATTSTAGAMSASDKTKLDGLSNYTHPTQTAIDTNTLTGADVISRIVVNTLGHTTTVTTRSLTAANIGAEPSFSKGGLSGSTGISLSGTLTSRLVGAGDITITNTDPGSAQNIFKNIANSGGTTQFSAGSNNDSIRIAGSGATTISFDAPTKTITISSTDNNTVYTHPAYTTRSIDTSGAQVIDVFTSDAIGSVTNITTRTMTLADLGYTGATNADNYSSWLIAASGTAGTGSVTSGSTVTITAGTNITATRSGNNITISSTAVGVTSLAATTPISVNASTGAVTITHSNSGVTAGTYNNVTVDATGHVTAASNVSYLTSYTETDTLQSVTNRGNSTTNSIRIGVAGTPSHLLNILLTNDAQGGVESTLAAFGNKSFWSTNDAASIQIGFSDLSSIYNGTDWDFYIKTGSSGSRTEKMRIKSNGDILYNTTSQSALAGVRGMVVAAASNLSVGISLANGTTTGTYWLIYRDFTNNTLKWFNGSDRLTLDGSGNLSIGGVASAGTQASSTTHLVRADRNISTGTGLTGGGNLTTDRTISISSSYALDRFFLAKGVRTQANDWNRSLSNINVYGLWQDNFAWLNSYYASRVIIQSETTGRITSNQSLDKTLTLGWGISTDIDYAGEVYCTCVMNLGPGVIDYNVLIRGTITITSTSEIKLYLEGFILNGSEVVDHKVRMITASVNLSSSNYNIAFTGLMSTTGTHEWYQKHTFTTVY